MSLCNKIFNMVKRGIVTRSSKDNTAFPTIQVTYLGKTKNIELVLPYGLYSNPKEKAVTLMFNVNGQEENIAGIPYDPNERFGDVKPGEVITGNPHAGTKIYFKENGEIDIDTSSTVNVNASNVHLGVGGLAIARLGDSITGQVIIPTGSSAGTYPVTSGVISSGSPNNTSI